MIYAAARRLQWKFVDNAAISENLIYMMETNDVVYVYNNYQLVLIKSDNSENEPIMSNDMIQTLLVLVNLYIAQRQ